MCFHRHRKQIDHSNASILLNANLRNARSVWFNNGQQNMQVFAPVILLTHGPGCTSDPSVLASIDVINAVHTHHIRIVHMLHACNTPTMFANNIITYFLTITNGTTPQHWNNSRTEWNRWQITKGVQHGQFQRKKCLFRGTSIHHLSTVEWSYSSWLIGFPSAGYGHRWLQPWTIAIVIESLTMTNYIHEPHYYSHQLSISSYNHERLS